MGRGKPACTNDRVRQVWCSLSSTSSATSSSVSPWAREARARPSRADTTVEERLIGHRRSCCLGLHAYTGQANAPCGRYAASKLAPHKRTLGRNNFSDDANFSVRGRLATLAASLPASLCLAVQRVPAHTGHLATGLLCFALGAHGVPLALIGPRLDLHQRRQQAHETIRQTRVGRLQFLIWLCRSLDWKPILVRWRPFRPIVLAT